MGDDGAEGSTGGSEAGAARARLGWLVPALALAGLFVAARALPLDRWIEVTQAWLDGLGVLGMALYVVIYVLAALLLVPGLALTVVAGALYGLVWGTALVSVASTTAAALAFLFARTFARSAVEARAQRSARFAAIDRAIEQGGWRIVALLRLSPAVPFSLGNYLYGLTAIRFWPYVLTSWLFMLPGTFLYVYVGYLSGEGLAAASGGEESLSAGRLALFVAGLAGTVVATVYVSRLARKALRERTEIVEG